MNQQTPEFQKALSAFQSGDLALAKSTCARMLKKKIQLADTAHLLALIYKQENDFKASRKHFEMSLAASPRQANVLSNYANLLTQHRKIAEAEKTYARATRTDPSLADAWYNWGTLLTSNERFEDAARIMQRAIEHHPRDPRMHLVRGIALRGLEEHDVAIAAFDTVMSLVADENPLMNSACQHKAITYRAANQPEEAVACLSISVSRNSRDPEALFMRACAYCDAGDFDAARQDFLHAIDIQPDHIGAHDALNKMYWEEGVSAEFLRSYEKNIPLAPHSASLRYAYASQLVAAEETERADAVLRQAVDEIGPQPELLHAIGALAIRRNQFDEAGNYIDRALAANPKSTRFIIDKANLLIRQGDYTAALKLLDQGTRIDPLDQEIWAYKGLCWRLAGDDRARWLNDYDTLVDAAKLDVPQGYDNLEHFLGELRSVLASLHRTNRQPLDQSVRNGTQTVGKLLSVQQKVIQDYKKVLTQSIERYVAGLPSDPEHPFLNRNVGTFSHTGSWSVRLTSGGFHVNHMHPQGWLSNCTYISVPKDIREDDPGQRGWIKFGETSLALGGLEAVERTICPAEGSRVLFPSYMWHGTVPFESSEPRMTLPSDIRPGR